MAHVFVDPEAWMLHAACFGRTELFFAPDDSESRAERRSRESEAKVVCHECVVRNECLSEAIESDERFGIWGGLTERERRAARRSPTQDDVAPHGAPATRVSPQDIAGPGRLARLPAVVVRGRAMSSSTGE
jgi:WhiB family redox-sensing transcriptional regulator